MFILFKYERYIILHSFTVLPKFRVKITLPEHIRDFDTSFKVSVSARYLFTTDENLL
jgi:hypothetical protein